MNSSFFISWFAVMFPLVISPGPANVMFAASGAKFGIKKSIPLMIGIDLIFVVQSILIGFGLGTIFKNNPMYLSIIQILGALYLFYLAYTFLLPILKKSKNIEKKLTFFDGIIIQFFNIKGWLLIILMFSLFANTDTLEVENSNTFLLIFMLFCLNTTCHFIWISLSSLIFKIFSSDSNLNIQNIIFSLSLFIVGIWLLQDNQIIQNFFK